MEEDVTIDGLDEMAAKLDQFPPKVAQKCIRPALVAGGKVMLAALQQTTPVRTGELVEAEISKVTANARNDDFQVIVGPKYVGGHTPTSTDPGVRDAFLEFGTRKMKPTFFMRRAFAACKDLATDVVVATLQAVLGELSE